MDRAGYFQEMGLGPVWQLRAAAVAPEATVVPLPEPAADPLAAFDLVQLDAAIRQCSACGLCRTRTQAVPGVGAARADWLFVGEAPGGEEDQRGEPFVGQAGRLLDNMLAALQLARGNNVYIANVLKCRPPDNRNPAADEIARCRPFLHRQIALVQPRVIVALGKFAAQTLLDSDAPIGSLRGRVHVCQGVALVCTYHPAYLLRSPAEKGKAWEDLCLARSTLTEALA